MVFTVRTSDATEVTASPSTVLFTPANWNIAQLITVRGVDDPLLDDLQTATLTISVNDANSNNDWDPLDDTLISVTNADNDVAGLLITQSNGTTVVGENGSTDSFTVKLTAQPTSNVVLTLVALDSTEATINRTLLTFTPTNWNSTQTVTVTGVNDVVVDGAIVSGVTLSIDAPLSDDDFDAVTPQTLNVTTTDNEPVGFRVAITGTTTSVSENGTTDTFGVALLAEPQSNVVITVSSANTDEATVSVTSLTFTPANWSALQNVTVTGINDIRVDGTQTTIVTLSVEDAASNDFFDPVANQTVTVTTTDNDQAGFTVVASDSSTRVTEAGSTDTLSVTLNARPLTDVVILVTVSDLTEAGVTPGSVRFTPSNWNVTQVITVVGVNDNLVDGSVSSQVRFVIDDAASDNFFDPVADQAQGIVTTDDDVAGIVLTATSGSTIVSEDGTLTDTVSVVLTAEPTSVVVIAVTSSNTTEMAVTPRFLTFSPADWNVSQVVTVVGVDDVRVDGTVTSTLRAAVEDAQSNDLFDVALDRTLAVQTTDNDIAGYAVTESDDATALSENGTTDTISVVLTAQPLANVVFEVTSSDTTEVGLTPTVLIFSGANWNTPQIITLIGINDPMVDGDQTSNIRIRINDAQTDNAFDALSDRNIAATNADNDQAGFALSLNGALVVSENGTREQFGIVLTSQPASPVVITLNSADVGEVAVSPASVTFTTANWNQPQSIFVTGVDDAFVDGPQSTLITASINAALSDAAFDDVGSHDVNVTTLDNDLPGFRVSHTDGATIVSEGAGSDSVLVVLTAAPTSNVVISVSATPTSTLTVGSPRLTFTPSNWHEPQAVEVFGVDDSVVDGNEAATISFAVVAAESASGFANTSTQSLAAYVIDDDSSELTITGSQATEGLPINFTLALSAPVTAETTVIISTVNGTATTADSDYVPLLQRTFTIPAMTTSKTFTVTTGDDARFELNESFSVTINGIGQNGRNVSVGGAGSATGLILNNDALNVTPNLFVEADVLRFRDNSGRADDLVVTFNAETRELVFSDLSNDLAAATGTAVSMHEVHVPVPTTNPQQPLRLIIELAGGNDRVDLSGLPEGVVAVSVSGGTGNDFLAGSVGVDALAGDDGNDVLFGDEGDDVLSGGSGSDSIIGGPGLDRLREAINLDLTLTNTTLKAGLNGVVQFTDFLQEVELADLSGGASRNRIDVTAFLAAGVTSIVGGGGNDEILGSPGPDLISTFSGADSIKGFAGADTILSGGGNDTVLGGLGNDCILGNSGDDSLVGDAGNDLLFGQDGTDTLIGNDGDDFLIGQAGPSFQNGGEGSDTLIGNTLTDLLIGEGGNDKLFGSGGTDSLSGGLGDDQLSGEDGNDALDGGDGADALSGGLGVDTINGGLGSDRLNELVEGNALIVGSFVSGSVIGTKTLTSVERINLSGGAGANLFDGRQSTLPLLLIGGDGNDTLLGGTKADILQGGLGDDVLSGGAGLDSFDGGDGTDAFYEKANTNFFVTGTTINSAITGTETPLNVEYLVLIGGDGNNLIDARQSTLRTILLGGRGNDTLLGSSQNDVISGGNRNDSTVAGADGIDSIDGGAGSDIIESDTADSIAAGAGDTALLNVFASLPSWIDTI